MVPRDQIQSSDKGVSGVTKIDIVGDPDVIESPKGPVDQSLFPRKVLATFYGQIQFTMLLSALFVFLDFRVEEVLLRYIWSFLNTLTFTAIGFGPNNYCKYPLAILYTATYSYIVAAIWKTKIISILLAAGITTEIFFFLLVICLFAKIGNMIWFLISLVAGVGVFIFGLIVLVLSLSGCLNNDDVIISLCLSIFIFLLLIDFHKILGIGWFSDRIITPDLGFYSTISLFRDVLFTFIFIIKLLDEEIIKK